MQAELPALVEQKLVSTLQHCRHKKDLYQAKRLHAYLRQHHLELHPVLGNYLVPLLVDCESLADARHVFDNLPHRNVYSWTSLISGYVNSEEPQHAFLLFRKMQEDISVQPNIHTHLVLLHACARLKEADLAFEVHMAILKQGFDANLFDGSPVIGNTLVDVYTKLGLLAEAHQVFDKLPVQNTISWNALLGECYNHGLGKEVGSRIQQMQLNGMSPNSVSFVCSLKACGNVGDLEAGQVLYAEITNRGLDNEVHVGGALVGMFSRCNSLADACCVFYGLPLRNLVLWNTLIAGYAKDGLGEEAYSCFQQMQNEGIPPNSITFVCSLKACGTMGALEIGQRLHIETIKRGLESELYVGNALLDMYSKCALIIEARQVFDKLPVQNSVLCNTLMLGYTNHGLGEEAQKCLQQLLLEDISPHSAFFLCSLKACSIIGALEIGHKIHAETMKRGLERELFLGSALVHMYMKCGSLTSAHHVFDKLSSRDAITWNALITRYSDHGFDVDVLNCLKQMQLEGMIPDHVTFVCGLKACANVGTLVTTHEMHAEITKLGSESDLNIGNNLVCLYSKFDLIPEAEHVLHWLPAQNASSWNALTTGYAEHGLDQQVLRCCKQMQLQGIPTDIVTFIICLRACGSTGALELGREMHAEIRKLGFESEQFIASMLIEMYGKCGAVIEGRFVFDRLQNQDVVVWTTLIKAYGENHEGDMAIQCFEDMQEQGVKPNCLTFTCLLAACSHASLVLDGQKYFQVMTEKHEIGPTLHHYACMVDLFARSGDVNEAERFLAAVQGPPSSISYKALLSACKLYGEVEMGEKCFQQLVKLNQMDASAYLLLADMYASASRWNDAKKLEGMRNHIGAEKKLGSALVEVSRELHEFVVGMAYNKNILEILASLNACVKNEGYVPSLDLVLRHLSSENEQYYHE